MARNLPLAPRAPGEMKTPEAVGRIKTCQWHGQKGTSNPAVQPIREICLVPMEKGTCIST